MTQDGQAGNDENGRSRSLGLGDCRSGPAMTRMVGAGNDEENVIE